MHHGNNLQIVKSMDTKDDDTRILVILINTVVIFFRSNYWVSRQLAEHLTKEHEEKGIL